MNRRGRAITCKSLTIKQKLEIIIAVESGENKKALSVKYDCDLTTINRIYNKREQIRKLSKTTSLKVKRMRRGVHGLVEDALFIWFQEQSERGQTFTVQMFLQKAKEISIQLNDEFEPDASWLWRWRKRHNIKYGKLRGEAVVDDLNAAAEYTTKLLPALLEKYSAEDILNAAASPLLYRSAAKQSSGRISQAKVTLLFICNATGTFKKVFVIGDSKNPRSFKEGEIPLPYYVSKKTSMTPELWLEILQKLNYDMSTMNRQVILFGHKAACQNSNASLSNIELSCLPANTTAALSQPLNDGIIADFKQKYRQIVALEQLSALERGESAKDFVDSVTLATAMEFIKQAWCQVKPETILSCFDKAGFIQNARLLASGPQKVNAVKEYVQCDDNLRSYDILTDDEVVEMHSSDKDNGDGNEDPLNALCETVTIPTTKAAFCALHVLECFSSAHGLQLTQKYITRIETELNSFVHKTK